jgi:hypothetical protein
MTELELLGYLSPRQMREQPWAGWLRQSLDHSPPSLSATDEDVLALIDSGRFWCFSLNGQGLLILEADEDRHGMRFLRIVGLGGENTLQLMEGGLRECRAIAASMACEYITCVTRDEIAKPLIRHLGARSTAQVLVIGVSDGQH